MLYEKLTLTAVSALLTANLVLSSAAQARSPKVSYFFDATLSQVREVRAARTSARSPSLSSLSTRLVHVSPSGAVQSYVHVNRWTPELGRRLRTLGVNVELMAPNQKVLQAWVPEETMEAVAALADVKRISPAGYAVLNTGSVTTEGDAILKSVLVRSAGFTGAGVKVCALSDGVEALNESVATGDLPTGIVPIGSCEIVGSTCDEGTAMLEIIHDIAPDATLGFASAPDSEIGFANNLTQLQTDGCQIIVDDVTYLVQPYFEDGLIAQTVKDLVSDGVIYVTSAGNYASTYPGHYQATYTDNGGYHDFGAAAGGASNTAMTLDAGYTAVFLQWNDPYTDDTPDNEYTLSLTDASLNPLDPLPIIDTCPSFENYNVCKLLVWENYGPAISAKLGIQRVSGTEANVVKMVVLGAEVQNFNTADHSIFGHAAVPGVLTVGAINAAELGQNEIAYYSSRGPVDMYTPAHVVRQKPDISGIDCVSVTGVGEFGSPFCGTSAAAPHIAGLAALLRSGLSTSATQIRTALTSTAVDLGTTGYDNIYGYGRADALAAAQSLNPGPDSSITSPSSAITITEGDTVDFAGECTHPGDTSEMTYLWNFDADSDVSNSGSQNPGAVEFTKDGTFTVTFTCTDGLGKADATPATVEVTVEPVAGSGGGGCAAGGVSALLIVLGLVAWARKQTGF